MRKYNAQTAGQRKIKMEIMSMNFYLHSQIASRDISILIIQTLEHVMCCVATEHSTREWKKFAEKIGFSLVVVVGVVCSKGDQPMGGVCTGFGEYSTIKNCG